MGKRFATILMGTGDAKGLAALSNMFVLGAIYLTTPYQIAELHHYPILTKVENRIQLLPLVYQVPLRIMGNQLKND